MKLIVVLAVAVLGSISAQSWTPDTYNAESSVDSSVASSSPFPTMDSSSPFPTMASSTLPPNPTANVDRECACSLENIWLDVVVVIDNSVGMSQDGLIQVEANVAGIFGQSQVGKSTSSNPKTTRVAVVTYAGAAQVQADLNHFTSTDQLIEGIFSLGGISSDPNSVIKNGLTAAETVLQQGRANNYRSNYKQVVIVYASEYNDKGTNDPIPAANRLKESGVTLITVAFDQGGEGSQISKLAELATPHDAFNNTDLNLVGEIQGALCQANCFCPDLTVQYSADFKDPHAYKYGVCLQVATISTTWVSAKFACQNLHKGGYLATEFDKQKHDFNLQYYKSIPNSPVPYMYHIGLNYVNGAYVWEQPQNQSPKPQSNQYYSAWNPGYPQTSSGTGCVLNQQSGSDPSVGWQNEKCYSVSKNYVCEVTSCDTDNYCEF